MYNIDRIKSGGSKKRVSVSEIMNYLSNVRPEEDKEKIIDLIKNHDDELMRTIAQSWIDEGREAGIKAGIQRGMQEGRQEEQYIIAKNMLSLGLDMNTINKSTGLSLDEIKKL